MDTMRATIDNEACIGELEISYDDVSEDFHIELWNEYKDGSCLFSKEQAKKLIEFIQSRL